MRSGVFAIIAIRFIDIPLLSLASVVTWRSVRRSTMRILASSRKRRPLENSHAIYNTSNNNKNSRFNPTDYPTTRKLSRSGVKRISIIYLATRAHAINWLILSKLQRDIYRNSPGNSGNSAEQERRGARDALRLERSASAKLGAKRIKAEARELQPDVEWARSQRARISH